MSNVIAGITIPDSRIAREASELIMDAVSPLLYHHSLRVFVFGALRGKHKGLKFDPELLFLGAMFHDLGLTEAYNASHDRFEVDGANAARAFMRSHGLSEASIDLVWDAIALHTTPGIPQHKKSVVALVTAGIEMDVLGLGFDEVSETLRDEVVSHHPRDHFKQDILQAFAQGTRHRPDTTFGNVKSDVLERLDPGFKRTNFCDLILNSGWSE